MKKKLAQFLDQFLDKYLGETLLAIIFFVACIDAYQVFGPVGIVIMFCIAVITLFFFWLFSIQEKNK